MRHTRAQLRAQRKACATHRARCARGPLLRRGSAPPLRLSEAISSPIAPMSFPRSCPGHGHRKPGGCCSNSGETAVALTADFGAVTHSSPHLGPYGERSLAGPRPMTAVPHRLLVAQTPPMLQIPQACTLAPPLRPSPLPLRPRNLVRMRRLEQRRRSPDPAMTPSGPRAALTRPEARPWEHAAKVMGGCPGKTPLPRSSAPPSPRWTTLHSACQASLRPACQVARRGPSGRRS